MRPIGRHLARLGTTILLGSLVAACALSPHTINVNPVVNVPPQDIGQGRALSLQVVDARPNKAFGARGGVYSDSSLISPSGDITGPIRSSLALVLLDYRFVVAEAGAASPLKLAVTVEDIRYSALGNPFVNNVRTEIILGVVCRNGEKHYKKRFTATHAKDVVTAPGPTANEEIINGAISKGLSSMMTDTALLDFLRG